MENGAIESFDQFSFGLAALRWSVTCNFRPSICAESADISTLVLHSCQVVANRPIGQIAASLAGTGPGDRNEKAGFIR